MIEGIRVNVKGEELIRHCQLRAERHEMKSRAYADEARKHPPGGIADEVAAPEAFYSNKVVRGARENLEAGSKAEKQRAATFRFLADHFDKNETYQLTLSQLGELELTEA